MTVKQGAKARPLEANQKPKGGRPTKQAAAALEQRILDTAKRLFASQGFAATSMEQIAAECHAGKDTIYRRYPSKEALFTAMVDRARAQVIADLDAAAQDDKTPLERLRQYARILLAINMRRDLIALNRVALAEAVPQGGMQSLPTDKDPFMTRFAGLVEVAQRDGAIVDGDPLFIADQLLYATSIKPLMAAMLGDVQLANAAAQERYFDRAWDMFMTGAAPRVAARDRASDP